MTRPEPHPLATNAVRRVRDAAEHGGRVTSIEVASLATEVLRHRREQRKRVREADACAAAVSADGSAKRQTSAAGPGRRRDADPSSDVLRRGIEAYVNGANVAEASEVMGVTAYKGRQLLVESGVEIRRSGWKR